MGTKTPRLELRKIKITHAALSCNDRHISCKSSVIRLRWLMFRATSWPYSGTFGRSPFCKACMQLTSDVSICFTMTRISSSSTRTVSRSSVKLIGKHGTERRRGNEQDTEGVALQIGCYCDCGLFSFGIALRAKCRCCSEQSQSGVEQHGPNRARLLLWAIKIQSQVHFSRQPISYFSLCPACTSLRAPLYSNLVYICMYMASINGLCLQLC